MPELLERLLKSIPERKDMQVVVVDDQSPRSEDYVAKYDFLKRKDVSFICSDKKGWAGHARNIGVKEATGEWLLFADSDDFFVEGFDKMLDRHCSDDVDVVYFNVRSVLSNDVTKEADRNVGRDNLFKQYAQTHDEGLFRYRYPEPWGKMVRRSFVMKNQIRFDETKVCNDYYFSMQIGCMARNISVVDEPLYVLTLREGSVSYDFADTLEKLLIRIDVATRVQLLLKKYHVKLVPMPLRGLMVILLKKSKSLFVKELFTLGKAGIPLFLLLCQMFNPRYMERKNAGR